MLLSFPLAAILTFSACLFGFGSAGNTTCVGNALDWYTDAVGETPCITYQRLRQICNSEYEVPSFRPNPPGDSCNDQLSSCCCNSVSWALSMLCMNCQQDLDGKDVNGIDAGSGAYYAYRMEYGASCGDGTNKTLPTDIQQAVCNVGLKLDDFLYNLFWNTGAWFYADQPSTYTRKAAQRDQDTDNNETFTHCANHTSTSTSQSSTDSPSSTLTDFISSLSEVTLSGGPTTSAISVAKIPNGNATNAIVGGAVGGTLGLMAIILGALCLFRRNRHSTRLTTPVRHYQPHTAPVEPFLGPTQGLDRSYRHRPRFDSEKRLPRKTSSSPRIRGGDSQGAKVPIGSIISVQISERPPSVEPTLTYLPSTSSRHRDGGQITVAHTPLGRKSPPYQNS